MAKHRRNRFMSQAALEALVRYGPEISGLQELRKSAVDNLHLAVNQARATAAGTQSAIKQARPDLEKVYARAGLAQAAIASAMPHPLVGGDLAGLSGGNSKYLQDAGALEAGTAAQNLNESRTAAIHDLADRSVRAAEGRTFTVNNARGQYLSDLGKIVARAQSLQQEKGAFTSATLGQLLGDQASRDFQAHQKALDRQNSADIAAGHDQTSRDNAQAKARAKARAKANAPKTPTGVKLATPAAHGAAQEKISSRLDDAKAFAKAHIARNVAAASLVHGIPDHPVLDANGKPVLVKNADGSYTKQVKQGVQKWGDNVWTSIALDMAYDGHVSRRNAKILWNRGIELRKLGLPGPAQAAKQRKQFNHTPLKPNTPLW